MNGDEKTQKYILKFRETHGDRYDYSKVVFIKSHINVEIICLEHGSFFQGVYSHIKGSHCPKCVSGNRKKTILEKYGVENVFQNKNIKQKIKKTNLEKYGTEWPTQSKQVQDKIQNTNIERYGVKTTLKVPEVQEKIKNTMEQKYSKNFYAQNHISNEALNKLNDAEWMFDQHVTQKKFLKQIGKELGVGECTVGNYLKKHNIETRIYNGSFVQKELELFLNKYVSIDINNRIVISPKELDLYVPEHNLGIEFNGVYYHSELFVDENYHIDKLLHC